MLKEIRKFPHQFAASLGIASALRLPRGFNRVYLVGMGGSSLAADLLNDCFQDASLLHVIRDYGLPPNITTDDLVIYSSYSGNTEETLVSLEQAFERNIPAVILTHGGKLAEIGAMKKIPTISIPESIQPRCAIGNFFASMAVILNKLKKIPDQTKAFGQLTDYLLKNAGKHEEQGAALAKLLKDRVPMIYGPSELRGVSRLWKVKLNENAKIQSFYNVFPEVNHNEMVGYTKLLMKPFIIYLKSQGMHSQIRKRMDIMEDLLKDHIPFHSIELSGKGLLQEIFDAQALADYTSYYLALEYGVDPVPVQMVESFKMKLKD